MPSEIVDELSGAFLDHVLVQDPTGTPTETVLGRSTDTITIGRDFDEQELELHQQKRKLTRITRDTVGFELDIPFAPSVQELQDMGVVDANGEIQEAEEDRWRTDVYDRDGDTNVAETVHFDDVLMAFTDHELGSDFSMLTVQVIVQGTGPVYGMS